MIFTEAFGPGVADTETVSSAGPEPPSDGQATLSIRLYLDAEGRPIGRVRSGASTEVAFAGWLELMAECSRLLRPGPGPAALDKAAQ